MMTVKDIVNDLKEMDTVLSHADESVDVEDSKMIFRLSCYDMNCVRSIFNAYKDILLKMEIKENE